MEQKGKGTTEPVKRAFPQQKVMLFKNMNSCKTNDCFTKDS